MLHSQTSQFHRFRVRIALRVLALSALLMACADSGPSNPLRLADGTITSPSQWQGDWVLINYWADCVGRAERKCLNLTTLTSLKMAFLS